MLDTHPRIYCGPESNLFTGLRIRKRGRIKELAQNFDVPATKIRQLLDDSRSLPEFIEGFFQYNAGLHGKGRWGEKTPTNVRNMGYVFQHFPETKFLHMIRDGRDSSCSLRHFPKRRIVDGKVIPLETDNPLDQCIKRWVQDVTLGRRYLGDPRYYELRYEDIVLNTEDALKNLFLFLDEPWDGRVLRYHEVEGSTRDPEKFPQNIEATTPLYEQAIGRWEKEYSEEDKLLFKELAGDMLTELGYEDNDDW